MKRPLTTILLASSLSVGACSIAQDGAGSYRYGGGKEYYALNSLSTVDDVVLKNTSKSRVVLFGEIHMRSPQKRSVDYVISLLPRLKKQGYTHFGIEVPTKNCVPKKIGNYSKNWKRLYAAVIQNKINFFCYDDRSQGMGASRDRLMFENVKRVMEDNPGKKVILYGGAWHNSETPVPDYFGGFFSPQKTLGYFLDRYTQGKSFSVVLRGISTGTPFNPKKYDLDLNLHPLK